MLETLRRNWVRQLGGENGDSFLIDTKPIPVMGYRRSKRRSNFSGNADYGYCAARKMSARHAAKPSSLRNRAVEVFRL